MSSENLTFKATLGKRIKELRDRLGFTQATFAKKLEISGSYKTKAVTISRWEREERRPNSIYLTKMATVFRANITWLLIGEGPMFIEQRQDAGIVAETPPPWGALTPEEWEFIKLSRESPRLTEACRKILGGSATYKAGFEELQKLPDPSET